MQHLANCKNITLERINNTQSTSVQDYLGSYMPVGGGEFVFCYGALARAMLNGDWIILDEFDLADPAVTSMLAPLLEGRRSLTIPNTNLTVTAKSSFRLFATQNGSSYAGRKPLPLSLRSRFAEIRVLEFNSTELANIIALRGGVNKSEAQQIGMAYRRINELLSKEEYDDLVSVNSLM